MISVYKLKPKFQKLLEPVLHSLNRLNITANQITISSIILSMVVAVLFWFSDLYQYLFLALPIGLFMRMALNALDGMMAKTFNQQSRLGEILNEIGDVVSDVMIFFPLLKFEHEHELLIVVFIFLSIINEFSGVLGKAVSGVRRYEGPMGKSDRALFMGIYGLLHFFSISIKPITFEIFIIVNFLLLLSTSIRILKTIK